MTRCNLGPKSIGNTKNTFKTSKQLNTSRGLNPGEFTDFQVRPMRYFEVCILIDLILFQGRCLNHSRRVLPKGGVRIFNGQLVKANDAL